MEIRHRDTKEVILIIDRYLLWRANLQGANLQGADLQGADLQKTSLWKANLRNANLQRADLQGANLQGANLQGANLQGANLWNGDLWNADLQGADLQGANLQRADLQGANLQGANLTNVIVNWNSHQLLSELLLEVSKTEDQKSWAIFIRNSVDLCWDDFLKIDNSEKEWGLRVLAGYINKNCEHPDVLNQYIKK